MKNAAASADPVTAIATVKRMSGFYDGCAMNAASQGR
jgi:hypothetical protein